MQSTLNPGKLVDMWFNPDDLDLTTAAADSLGASNYRRIHYTGLLERRQETRLMENPDYWSRYYIICNFIAERGPLLNLAYTIPEMEEIAPNRKVSLIRAWLIAMAGLSIRCYDCQLSLEKKQREIDQLWKDAQFPWSMVSAWWTSIKEQLSVEHLKLNLAACYYELFQTICGDKDALNDALIRVREHLEMIERRDPAVLGKVLAFWQMDQQERCWVAEEIEIEMLEGMSTDWVKEIASLTEDSLASLPSSNDIFRSWDVQN